VLDAWGMPEVDLQFFKSDGPMAAGDNSAGYALVIGSERKGPVSESSPFILSLVLPVVPAWLVKQILKDDFVDMAELLWDNFGG